jgi:hypothetical protein
MTNIEQIMILANQLANDGKKPSVALIKAKLSSPVPLPQIIASLKSWSHEPENCVFPETNSTTHKTDDKTNALNTVTIAELNDAIAPINKELAEIKRLLEVFVKNND